ncbi:hypothetical protein Trydic_g7812 [Trypoxylus dichotomus]
MGKCAPVFLAYVLNSFGVNIFREIVPGCEPLISCLIFLTAVFFLLWDMRLYPSSLRKLSRCGACVIEFLIAAFLMEHIMTDFWFPLESSLMSLLPKIAAAEEDLLQQGGWKSTGVFAPLRYNGTQVIASYMLSIFFLFAVMHATRMIDLRLLTSCGVGVFLKDIIQKLKKSKKKLFKLLFRRRQVKFKFGSSRSKSLASSSDYDHCDCDCEYDELGGEEHGVPDENETYEDDDVDYSYPEKY